MLCLRLLVLMAVEIRATVKTGPPQPRRVRLGWQVGARLKLCERCLQYFILLLLSLATVGPNANESIGTDTQIDLRPQRDPSVVTDAHKQILLWS